VGPESPSFCSWQDEGGPNPPKGQALDRSRARIDRMEAELGREGARSERNDAEIEREMAASRRDRAEPR
jgi:hypothetical protein